MAFESVNVFRPLGRTESPSSESVVSYKGEDFLDPQEASTCPSMLKSLLGGNLPWTLTRYIQGAVAFQTLGLF